MLDFYISENVFISLSHTGSLCDFFSFLSLSFYKLPIPLSFADDLLHT